MQGEDEGQRDQCLLVAGESVHAVQRLVAAFDLQLARLNEFHNVADANDVAGAALPQLLQLLLDDDIVLVVDGLLHQAVFERR